MSFSTHQSPEVDKSRPPLGGLNKEHQPEVANPVWQHMAQHDGGGVPSVQTQLDAGVAETEVGGDAEHEAPTDAGVGLPGGVASPVPAAAPAPVGPNACNTQAEEDQKNRFRLSAKSVNRFRPSSGYGMFDATYSPLTSLMTASVKMKFNFLQAPDTPDVFTLAGLLATGNIADVAKYFWTAGQQRQYESDYMIKVASMWSLQHTFTSSKACWPFTANPIVYPSIVQSDSDAHFMVDVHKMSDPANKRTSKFGARNPGTAGWQGTGELDENDVIDDPNKRNLRVARSERQRLDRAIATALASPILFAHNSKVIKPVDVAKLNSLATLMKQKNPSDPAVPLFISGAASAEGGSAHNQTLSEDRANAVRDVLQAAGVPHTLVPSGSGGIGAPDDANNRRVNLAADSNFESTYTGNRFSPAAHEFGHAIGLPDEYKNNTTGNLGAKQTSFVALAGAAGVLAPPRWGDRTSSVMSVGVDVLPRHYLTLWEALGSMTNPDITQAEWSIQ